jgi:hypothetical protein
LTQLPFSQAFPGAQSQSMSQRDAPIDVQPRSSQS